MISVFNQVNGKWEIKTLAEAGIIKEEPVPVEPVDNVFVVNKTIKAWNWLCINGTWLGDSKGVGYTDKSIMKALRIAAGEEIR